MPPLHRHQLARLTDDGWQAVLGRPWEDEVQACLAHWAARRLPLVVTRQPAADGPTAATADRPLGLGLAAPLRWQRRRLALHVERRHVGGFDEFPAATDAAPLLPPGSRPAWQRVCASLEALAATTRAYGSHGWQLLSGLPCLHDGSDIDLWAAVAGVEHADAVAAVFEAGDAVLTRRLDGELMFPDGRAFAWREWQAWRRGRSRTVLCKTLDGASLVASVDGLRRPSRVAVSVASS